MGACPAKRADGLRGRTARPTTCGGRVMVTRAQIVAEARSWLGTPFLHQNSMKAAGCDCIGLIRGVFREVGLKSAPEKLKQASCYSGYSSTPDGVMFKEACDLFMVPIAPDAI